MGDERLWQWQWQWQWRWETGRSGAPTTRPTDRQPAVQATRGSQSDVLYGYSLIFHGSIRHNLLHRPVRAPQWPPYLRRRLGSRDGVAELPGCVGALQMKYRYGQPGKNSRLSAVRDYAYPNKYAYQQSISAALVARVPAIY